MTSQMDRRDFVKTVAVSAGTAVAQHLLSPMLSADTTPGNNGMIYRTLGRTGERVSLVGLGGWHIGPPSVPERDSLQLIRQAIDRGINFLDNCQSYNAGESESRMGKALQDGYREKVFLMTKIDGRTKQEANRQIDRCLSRLRTDRIDLLQFP
jgi:aryl-alcohol dehydrogenase-like predicted oxidoreductase